MRTRVDSRAGFHRLRSICPLVHAVAAARRDGSIHGSCRREPAHDESMPPARGAMTTIHLAISRGASGAFTHPHSEDDTP